MIAREYRLPAVLGADGATSRIRDGQLVEVDGDRGVVRLHADVASRVEPGTMENPNNPAQGAS